MPKVTALYNKKALFSINNNVLTFYFDLQLAETGLFVTLFNPVFRMYSIWQKQYLYPLIRGKDF